MSEFTYLFRGAEQSGSPEQEQQHMQKWGTWINDLRAKGYVKELGAPP